MVLLSPLREFNKASDTRKSFKKIAIVFFQKTWNEWVSMFILNSK